MAESVVVAEGVSHRVGDEAMWILRDLSLDVEAGEVVAVEGRSGSGKSTLLSILGLLLRPDAGEVRICGVAAGALGDAGRTRLRAASIGFVFQNYSLLPTRNAWQNVSLPLMSSDVPVRDHRRLATAALSQVGLADRATAMPTHLSGGEQQRVAIARALVTSPSLVLADEPTGALDLTTGVTVLDTLFDGVRRRGSALVLVTHDPEVAALADRRLTLSTGALVA